MRVNIKEDFKQVQKMFKALPEQSAKAGSRAVNDAAAKGKTKTVSHVSKRNQVKSTLVRPNIIIKKSSPETLTAYLITKNIHFRLSDLKIKVKQDASGITYGGKHIPGGFGAKMPSGHAGAFIRTGSKRLPIRELYAGSIDSEFLQNEVFNEFDKIAGLTFVTRFDHHMGRILK